LRLRERYYWDVLVREFVRVYSVPHKSASSH